VTFMSERLNNIELKTVEETKNKIQNGSLPMEKHIEGEFRLNGSPMFVAELKSDYSNFIVAADEPKILGGQGVHTTPLSYLLFGVMACYASTLAIQCALDKVKLNTLKLKGHLFYDLAPVLTESNSPIIKKLILEIEADKDIREQINKANEKCPALYAIKKPIEVQTHQIL
jgi:uncharacterized OsmC-like protein